MVDEENIPGSVNDQFLTAISLDFGKNAQIPGAILSQSLLSVIQANDYRITYRHVRSEATPAVGPGTIDWTFDPPVNERWKVVAGSLDNTDAVSGMTINTLLGFPALGFRRAGSLSMAAGFHSVLIGKGELGRFNTNGSGTQGFIPSSVIIPNASSMRILASPATGAFDGNPLILFLLIEVLPIERRALLTAPTTLVVP